MEDGDGEGEDSSGGRIVFSYVLSFRPRQKSIAPMLLSLGSGAPTAAKIFPTERMYCSTLRLWIKLVVGCKDTCADLVSKDL